jgi:hypothetical protein
MGEEEIKFSDLQTCGCLAKVNEPINKKQKLGSKTAIHNMGYRVLIINFGTPNMNVGTIMESRDATIL